MKKIALIISSLLLSSGVFAAPTNPQIKLLNASSPLKTMVFTYNICDSQSNKCTVTNATTAPLNGSEIGGVSTNIENANLVITKIIETENGKEVARSDNPNGICKAVFGIDSTLIFNDYGTSSVVCSFGYSR